MYENDGKESKGSSSSNTVPIIIALISALVTIIVAFKDPIAAMLFPSQTPTAPAAVSSASAQSPIQVNAPTLQFEPCPTNDHCTNYRQIKEVVGNPNPFSYGAEYSADISSSDQIRFLSGWCAKDEQWLNDDLQHIQFTFVIDGVSYQNQLGTERYSAPENDFPVCIGAGIGVSGWQSGVTYRVVIGMIMDADVFDGETTTNKGAFLRTTVLTVK